MLPGRIFDPVTITFGAKRGAGDRSAAALPRAAQAKVLDELLRIASR
jgi:hypothetical protein